MHRGKSGQSERQILGFGGRYTTRGSFHIGIVVKLRGGKEGGESNAQGYKQDKIIRNNILVEIRKNEVEWQEFWSTN